MGNLQAEIAVPYETVRAAFLNHNKPEDGAYGWTLGILDLANEQFGKWIYTPLDSAELGNIMLPRHEHQGGQEIVPEPGLTVSQTNERLAMIPATDPCNAKVSGFQANVDVPVFLSAEPIQHPAYRGLTQRGYHGLTHLDGLHHLILWQRTGRVIVPAYIALNPR